MCIAFITDIHFAGKGKTSHNVDVNKNLDDVLQQVKLRNCNHIIIGGDICFSSPDKMIYKWMKQKLDATQLPYTVIGGNHDDNKLIAEVFNYEAVNNELYFEKPIGGINFYFLDSNKAKISSLQINWLKQKLGDKHEACYVVIHHPPLLSKMVYMDKEYPLENHEEIVAALHSFDFPVYVFAAIIT